MITANQSRTGAIVVAWLGSCCLGPFASAAPSIADFAAEADFGTPTLSPDGQKIAYVAHAKDGRVLVVEDLATHKTRPLLSATSDTYEISWCRFKNDDRLLCGFAGTIFADGQPYPQSRLVAVDVSGADKPRVLIKNSGRRDTQFQDRIVDWQVNDPRHVLIELTGESDYGPFPSVNSLDVYSGTSRMVERSRIPITDWHTDRQGVVRFGSGYDEHQSQYVTRDKDDAPWRTLAKWDLGSHEQFDVYGFGTDPEMLLVSDQYKGRSAVFEMDLTEKNERQLLFAQPEVDVDGPIYWPTDHRVVGFRYQNEWPQRMLIDTEAARVYASLDRAIPNANNWVLDSSRDGSRLLIASYTDVRPANYYLLDSRAHQLQLIGSENPALAKTALSPMKPVKIKGPGGITLPGYLTLPAGSQGKKLPMVVYPHGGPYARDDWGFDSMVQFMASRGYAVLQVNYRGSTGYGDEWLDAGLRNWGTVMVDDISAATRWAIAEGIADPAHTCIVGWSYGGYAALMSAVREPDLYRCVVSIAGVSDLRALYEQEQRFYGGRYRAKYSIGSDVDELKAGSPLRAPEKITAPVLMVHGDDDIQVNVDHSKRMARALKSAGKKYELVIIEDGNHSLSRYEWRQTLLTKLEAFLATNN
jgi:dipeptidyl aminopeptidase/acylaminoacyl peptidase